MAPTSVDWATAGLLRNFPHPSGTGHRPKLYGRPTGRVACWAIRAARPTGWMAMGRGWIGRVLGDAGGSWQWSMRVVWRVLSLFVALPPSC